MTGLEHRESVKFWPMGPIVLKIGKGGKLCLIIDIPDSYGFRDSDSLRDCIERGLNSTSKTLKCPDWPLDN